MLKKNPLKVFQGFAVLSPLNQWGGGLNCFLLLLFWRIFSLSLTQALHIDQ